MTGETITVTYPGGITTNDYGEEMSTSPVTETVDNVIVGPAQQSDATDAQRPYGTGSGYSLYFPRSWAYRSLRGATVKLAGSDSTWHVTGDPRPVYTDLAPTGYLPMAVTITTQEG